MRCSINNSQLFFLQPMRINTQYVSHDERSRESKWTNLFYGVLFHFITEPFLITEVFNFLNKPPAYLLSIISKPSGFEFFIQLLFFLCLKALSLTLFSPILTFEKVYYFLKYFEASIRGCRPYF